MTVEVQQPFTVWFTGLSGSGKSTLARALSMHFAVSSVPHQVLDGDELRKTLCQDLGFTKKDRDENVRRIAIRANEINEANEIAIVAAISPYREARQKAREKCGRFVEVFVDCSLATLVLRDPKGLYKSALAGELRHFSGVSDPYEQPERPDIYVNSDTQTIEESVERVLDGLRDLGFLIARLRL